MAKNRIANTRLEDLPDVLKPSEVGQILRVSRAQVYRLMATGSIPTIRFGKCVRVTRRALMALIEGNEASGLDVSEQGDQPGCLSPFVTK